MNLVKYNKDLFESISDFRKVVLILFSIVKDVDLSDVFGFLKNDNNQLCLEFGKTVPEQNDFSLEYIKMKNRIMRKY